MASKIQRLGVREYKIVLDSSVDVQGGSDNAKLFFDVGTWGEVNISGGLNVSGNLTSISSENLEVSDNIIYVNVGGGTASGIPAGAPLFGQSGLTIERFVNTGNNPQFIFDENLRTTDGSNLPSATPGIKGAFSFQSEASGTSDNLGLRQFFGLYAQSISVANDSNLYLLNNQVGSGASPGADADEISGVVTVRGTAFDPLNPPGFSSLVPYEERVFPYEFRDGERKIVDIPGNQDRLASPPDQDALITAKILTDYVRDYHELNFQSKIAKDYPGGSETSVEVFDQDVDQGESQVVVKIDGSTVATFFSTQSIISGVKINTNEISPAADNEALIIKGSGKGVVVDDFQEFTMQDPLAVDIPTSGTRVYADTLADGGTGLYFAHQDGTRDELVSRNKALLFSIIF